MQKITKKLISVLYAAVMPKLRPGKRTKLGGRLSHEFAIFLKILHKRTKCINFKSILVNNLNVVLVRIVRIPLFDMESSMIEVSSSFFRVFISS